MSVANSNFNPSGLDIVTQIKNKAKELEGLMEQVPNCRRKSVGLTHLETASMWLVKAAVVGDSE